MNETKWVETTSAGFRVLTAIQYKPGTNGGLMAKIYESTKGWFWVLSSMKNGKATFDIIPVRVASSPEDGKAQAEAAIAAWMK